MERAAAPDARGSQPTADVPFGCPDCGCDTMTAVRDLDGVTFQCAHCSARWRIELGYLHRVRGKAGGKSANVVVSA